MQCWTTRSIRSLQALSIPRTGPGPSWSAPSTAKCTGSAPQSSASAPLASSLQGANAVSPSASADEPPVSTAQSGEETRASRPGLPLVLLFAGIALAAIALGGYGLYRFLTPATKQVVALNSPAPVLQPTPKPAYQSPVPATPEGTPASSSAISPGAGAELPSPALEAMAGRSAGASPETDPIEQALSDVQNANRNGNWEKAVSTYVDLAERYPNRPEPRQGCRG